jgi:hypothetical protein
MNLEDLYRQSRYSLNPLSSDRRFMKYGMPEMIRAVGQRESTGIATTGDVIGNAMKSSTARYAAQLGETGETQRRGMMEKGATGRTELEIAGSKALRNMMESGLFRRQSMAQGHERGMLDRAQFHRDKEFGRTEGYLSSTSSQEDQSYGDISSLIDDALSRRQQQPMEVSQPRQRTSQDEWGVGGEVGSKKKSLFDYMW